MAYTTLEDRPKVHRPAELSSTAQTAVSRWLPLFGRCCLAAIFLVSGFAKLTDWQGSLGYLKSQLAFYPEAALGLAAAVEILAGLGLVLGVYTRVSALALAGFLAVTTFVMHDFWTLADPERRMQMVQFMKNLAIFGGLLVVASYGPGRLGMDNAGSQRVDRRPPPDLTA